MINNNHVGYQLEKTEVSPRELHIVITNYATDKSNDPPRFTNLPKTDVQSF